MPSPNAATDTPNRILDVAEGLVQTRGFNAFSYADIADALHVTKASLHYHFPTKAALGQRLIERYCSSFLDALAGIDLRCPDAKAKLRAYAGLYGSVLANNRMCLCGMMAADYATLPQPMKQGVQAFFDANEAWLVKVLESGRAAGQLAFAGSATGTAGLVVAALEGAMLIARSQDDPSRLQSAANRLLATFGIAPARRLPGAKA